MGPIWRTMARRTRLNMIRMGRSRYRYRRLRFNRLGIRMVTKVTRSRARTRSLAKKRRKDRLRLFLPSFPRK